MKLADFLTQEEGSDSRKLPDGRFAATWDWLGRCWNVGPGITVGVTRDTVWTQEQLDEAEAKEFADVEACVARCVKVPITNNQRVALESLAYNIGDGGFEHSTVLRDVNAGKMAEAAQAFLLWNKCHGEVVSGLIKRRKDEIRLFQHSDDEQVPADLRAVKTAITATMDQLPQATAVDSAPLLPVPGSAPKPSTGGGLKMNKLLFKMGGQWALARMGELSTWAGIWTAAHADYNVFLNPNLETAITNIGLSVVAAGLVMMKEGWHAPVLA